MKKAVVKRILSIALATAMVFSLAACGGADTKTTDGASTKAGGEPDSGEEKDPASKGENVTISVSSRYSADIPDDEFYRKKVEEFNAMDNGITVEMDNIVTESDYLDKLRTAFANGDTPNVFIEYGGSRALDYIQAEAVVDMKPYYDEDPDWYTSFYESMFEPLVYPEYEGSIWGTPFKSYVVSLFYNKEIFEQQGLAAPTNWDELMDVCEKLSAAGIQPFQAGEKDTFRFGHFHNNIIIKSLGVEGVDKLADRSLAYDSPEMVETYQKIVDMNEKGYLGVDTLNMDYTTEKETYYAEGCAMRWDGSWFVSEVYGKDVYDKTGAIALPTIDEKYAKEAQGGASDMWYVSKLNKSEEEIAASVEFVKYITSTEYFAGNNEVAAVVYPVKFEATENTPENPLLDEVTALLDGYTAVRTDVQNYDPESHMLDTVRNALQGIAMGNSAEQCAKEITERIEIKAE